MLDRKRSRRRWVVALTSVGALAVLALLGYRLAVEEWWIRQLSSPDLTTRVEAAKHLSELDSSRAILPLARARTGVEGNRGLEAKDDAHFFLALERIVTAGDRERLHEALEEPSSQVKFWALTKLGDLPPDDGTYRRVARLFAAGVEGSSSSGPGTEAAFFVVLTATAWAVLETYGRKAAGIVEEGLSSGSQDWLFRNKDYDSLLLTLGPNAKRAMSMLVASGRGLPPGEAYGRLWRCLRYFEDEAHLELLAHAAALDPEARGELLWRVGFVQTVEPHAAEVVDALIHGLTHADPAFRAYCAHSLGKAPEEEARRIVPVLVAMLLLLAVGGAVAAAITLGKEAAYELDQTRSLAIAEGVTEHAQRLVLEKVSNFEAVPNSGSVAIGGASHDFTVLPIGAPFTQTDADGVIRTVQHYSIVSTVNAGDGSSTVERVVDLTMISRTGRRTPSRRGRAPCRTAPTASWRSPPARARR